MHSQSAGLLAAALLVGVAPVATQEADSKTIEWRHYGADHRSTKYSPSSQIDRSQLDQLRVAWRWQNIDADVEASVPAAALRATPLMVGGRLYAITAYNIVVALDPASGKTLWTFDPKAYERGRVPHGGYNSRGLEYWTDGKEERLLIGTTSLQLVSLDAKTGEPTAGFGNHGIVDMRQGLDRDFNPREIGLNSPPIVCGDVVVVGSIVNDFGTRQRMPPGHVRGYDLETGERRWIFHTVPQEGELGVESWENESWRYTGNTNVWSLMSCDDEHGTVYLPVSTPTDDHYGGHRLGDNLFAESLVCLEAKTGKRLWHFQAVHHGIWDYDFPAAPNLVDIEVDGKTIPAVAQVSKQGFTYVFNRLTGEPVWPIEERPAPASRVPGERTAETQPFPTRPPPFELQGVVEENLIDLTPELKAEALEILADFETGPLFTPPIIAGQDGKKSLLQLPGMAGGANWGGAAVDPESGILYVPSQTQVGTMGLLAPASRSDLRYNRGFARVEGPQGLPLTKPPFARVTAIDLNRGDIVWQVPLGDGPRDHPALAALDLGRLGAHRIAGLSPGWPLLTRTLLFVAQSIATDEGPVGTLQAFDKRTGEQLWRTETRLPIQGAPMTYVHSGKQYIVVAVASRNQGELIAWALP